jgi:hypothetical protein
MLILLDQGTKIQWLEFGAQSPKSRPKHASAHQKKFGMPPATQYGLDVSSIYLKPHTLKFN